MEETPKTNGQGTDAVPRSQNPAAPALTEQIKDKPKTAEEENKETRDAFADIRSDVAEIRELLTKGQPRKPPYCPEKDSIFKHLFLQMPVYTLRRLASIQWLRMFTWLLLAAVTVFTLLQWRLLYADNCAKQAEIGRLEIVETKYRTLKGWAEKDRSWRMRFMLIDRCYSDTAYYRDDITAIQNHITDIQKSTDQSN